MADKVLENKLKVTESEKLYSIAFRKKCKPPSTKQPALCRSHVLFLYLVFNWSSTLYLKYNGEIYQPITTYEEIEAEPTVASGCFAGFPSEHFLC